jgi:hypothetical protein
MELSRIRLGVERRRHVSQLLSAAPRSPPLDLGEWPRYFVGTRRFNSSNHLPNESGMTCTRTLTTNTRTAYVADVNCTGEREMKGQVSIETTGGGTAFTGSMTMATTAQGRTMNVAMKMSGKYLSADCGTVK